MSRVQSMLFLVGGILMVLGAGCFAFMYAREVACWIYLVGALLFAWMQVSEIYEGNNPTIKRLKRIMTLADILFVFSGLLMVDTFTNYTTYIEVVYNKWVLLLLVAAILEMYTMHRISSCLKKEENTTNAQ